MNHGQGSGSPIEDQVAQAWELSRDGQVEAGLALLHGVVEAHPESAVAHFELGGYLDSQGREADAVEPYQRAVELGLSADLHAQWSLQYGSTLRNVGRLDEAIDVLRVGVGEHPEYPAIDLMLCLALRDAGLHDEAGLVALRAALKPDQEGSIDRYRRALTAYTAESASVSGSGVGVSWSEFELAVPSLASTACELIYRGGEGEALLVTVRRDQPPRVHPVNVGVVDGHLYTFVQAGSAKRRDLDDDGRWALHTHMDPDVPHELMLRGSAKVVDDSAIRSAVASDWFFRVSDSYPLYELLIEHALLGERATADEWPPRYSSWRQG